MRDIYELTVMQMTNPKMIVNFTLYQNTCSLCVTFEHSMQFIKTFIATFLLFSFCSCDFDMWASNYDFETTAIYIAPKSNATATVLTKGYVPKGADLGDENECLITTRITFSDKPTDVIKISSNGFKVLTAYINDTSIAIRDSSNYAAILKDCSERIGLHKLVDTEIKELSEAILATGAGPKGTFLKGQTKAIIVDTVAYSTKDR